MKKIFSEIDSIWNQGYNDYKTVIRGQKKYRKISQLSSMDLNRIKSLFSKLILNSKQNFTPKLIVRALYYYSVLKSHIYKIKNAKFGIFDFKTFDDDLTHHLICGASVYKSFSELYPREISFFHEELVSLAQVSKIRMVKKDDIPQLFSLLSELIYRCNCAQSLLELREIFQHHFPTTDKLNMIIRLCDDIINIEFQWLAVPHKELAVSVFSMMIIALSMDKKIPTGTVCKTKNIEVNPTTVNNIIKKILNSHRKSVNENPLPENLKTPELADAIREFIVVSILRYYIVFIRKTSDLDKLNKFILHLFSKLDFFENNNMKNPINKDIKSHFNILIDLLEKVKPGLDIKNMGYFWAN